MKPNKKTCNETPKSELAAQALEHYEKISSEACHWNSVIPNAVKFWAEHVCQVEEGKPKLIDLFKPLREHLKSPEPSQEKECEQPKCKYCWDKGFYSVWKGVHGSADFPGDPNYGKNPDWNVVPCPKCSETPAEEEKADLEEKWPCKKWNRSKKT